MQTTNPWKYDPNRPAIRWGSSGEKLVGIRGWLLLPAIGLFAAVVVRFARLFTIGEMRVSLSAGEYAFAIGVEGGMAIFVMVVAIAFFSRWRVAPKLLIAYMWTNAAIYGLHLLLSGSPFDPDLVAQLFGKTLASAVWTLYFMRSKRVRATFVE